MAYYINTVLLINFHWTGDTKRKEIMNAASLRVEQVHFKSRHAVSSKLPIE
jgi:hypothetical protein